MICTTTCAAGLRVSGDSRSVLVTVVQPAGAAEKAVEPSGQRYGRERGSWFASGCSQRFGYVGYIAPHASDERAASRARDQRSMAPHFFLPPTLRTF